MVDKGYNAHFTLDTVYFNKDKATVLTVTKSDPLTSIQELHERLGHVNYQAIYNLAKTNLEIKFDTSTKPPTFCKGCVQGKLTTEPRSNQTKQLLDDALGQAPDKQDLPQVEDDLNSANLLDNENKAAPAPEKRYPSRDRQPPVAYWENPPKPSKSLGLLAATTPEGATSVLNPNAKQPNRGSILRYKARYVTLGNLQIEGLEFVDMYSCL
ncbi:hypothetical protein HK098_007788, partial [Nowakowskiella sp. JEL0407]